MRPEPPRVAFFPDSYQEVNGVAHTARQFTGWAERTGKPMLCVCAGGPAVRQHEQGSVQLLELPRGFASFALDKDLSYDPLWLRHVERVARALELFRPEIIHVTGPSEVGLMGVLLARRFGVPLVASWHTNVHEYAARRAGWLLHALPASFRPITAARIESAALWGAARLYREASLLFAPNSQLCALLREKTGRSCRLMMRGVDAELFRPSRRTAPLPEESGAARTWTLGYVGRLSVEKNVALLPRVAAELPKRGFRNICFLVVGQGSEEKALRLALPNGSFTGVLRGEALAEAYSNMDLFVFPSHTDTFGNVVLEAMSSGVPAIVTPDGGPAYIVEASEGAGIIADDGGFADAIAGLLGNGERHTAMREQARRYALTQSWDAIFRGVYDGYEEVREQEKERLSGRSGSI